MNLLVLAGGFGTRLKSAVPDVPKALAPVCGLPFLQFQIENWRTQGLNDFSFLLYHQADQIVEFLNAMKDGLLKGCQVTWLIEPKPLNTGGAIANAVKTLGMSEDFLMTNADTWLGAGIRELKQFSAPAMAVVNMSDISRYGQVVLNHTNLVTSFLEKNQQSQAGWINAGLSRLSVSEFIDWDGQPFSLERQLFAKLIENRNLKAVPLQTDFIDIGVPADYHRFCRWIENGRQVPL